MKLYIKKKIEVNKWNSQTCHNFKIKKNFYGILFGYIVRATLTRSSINKEM